MIKQEIRSIIRNLLPKIDKANAYHDNFINGVCEKVIAQMYNDVFEKSSLNLQRYTKGYGYTTPIAVLIEEGTGIQYATLPESIIPFQDKASGVRRISTMAQGGFTFFPIAFKEMDLIASGSYVKTVNSRVGYAVNQTRVEFYGMPSSIRTVGVRMDLIIPFSKYGEDDEVKIPEITDTRTGETFVDRAIKILGIVRPVDLKDDNSSSSGLNQKDN